MSGLEVMSGLLVAFVVAALMEPWARVLHGRIWHHSLWGVHRSHHEPRTGRFERNDALSFLHAPIAAGLVIAGCQLRGLTAAVLVGAGVGMTLFGVGYVLVHDGLVHERIPMRWLLRWRFFRRVRGAHLLHHRTGGVPFGLFLGPQELGIRRAARERRASSRRGERTAPASPAADVDAHEASLLRHASYGDGAPTRLGRLER